MVGLDLSELKTNLIHDTSEMFYKTRGLNEIILPDSSILSGTGFMVWQSAFHR